MLFRGIVRTASEAAFVPQPEFPQSLGRSSRYNNHLVLLPSIKTCNYEAAGTEVLPGTTSAPEAAQELRYQAKDLPSPAAALTEL
jgi:hypothetical protein